MRLASLIPSLFIFSSISIYAQQVSPEVIEAQEAFERLGHQFVEALRERETSGVQIDRLEGLGARYRGMIDGMDDTMEEEQSQILPSLESNPQANADKTDTTNWRERTRLPDENAPNEPIQNRSYLSFLLGNLTLRPTGMPRADKAASVTGFASLAAGLVAIPFSIGSGGYPLIFTVAIPQSIIWASLVFTTPLEQRSIQRDVLSWRRQLTIDLFYLARASAHFWRVVEDAGYDFFEYFNGSEFLLRDRARLAALDIPTADTKPAVSALLNACKAKNPRPSASGDD